MRITRLLPKQMFCGRLVVQKIANKSLKGDSGMTGNKRNTDRRQQELPVHNQPNLWRVVQRICIDNAHQARNRALHSLLEMGIYKIQDGD